MNGWIFSIHKSEHGMPKMPDHSGEVTSLGLVGDRVRNLKHHGGEDRALCLFSLERITSMQQEGHPIFPGSTGENLVLAGLDWDLVTPGARIKLGSQVEIEITSYATPCSTIKDSFVEKQISRISEKTNPGWARAYARVLTPGHIQVGDTAALKPA
jgi:MOSC domain-containing protein YiiM